jgi:hypothetical protein
MRGVAVVWESVMCTITQNCSSKYSFGIKDALDIKEEVQDNCDWMELQGEMNCPSSFEGFVNMGKLILTIDDQMVEIASMWCMRMKRRG